MSVEASMRLALIANATTLSRFGQRIYPLIVPQDVTFPYIAFSRVTGAPEAVSTGTNATRTCRIQLNIVDDSYDDTWTAANEVSTVLRAWTDPSGTPSVSGCDLSMEMDGNFDLSDDAEDGTYRVIQDYDVWYS